MESVFVSLRSSRVSKFNSRPGPFAGDNVDRETRQAKIIGKTTPDKDPTEVKYGREKHTITRDVGPNTARGIGNR